MISASPSFAPLPVGNPVDVRAFPIYECWFSHRDPNFGDMKKMLQARERLAMAPTESDMRS